MRVRTIGVAMAVAMPFIPACTSSASSDAVAGSSAKKLSIREAEAGRRHPWNSGLRAFPEITVEDGIRIFLTGGMALPRLLRL